MLDLIKKQRQFFVTTPISSNRLVELTEDFQDDEFDSWGAGTYKGVPSIFFYKDGEVYLRLQYMEGAFQGRDPRGGISILRPNSDSAVKAWKDWHVGPKKVNLRPEYNSIIRNNKNAMLRDKMYSNPNLNTEGYDVYDIKEDYYDIIDKLFSAGYENVLVLNCHATSNAPQLVLNMAANSTGSVIPQFYSGTDGDGGKITEYAGEFKGYLLNSKIWAVIKTPIKKAKTSFESSLEKVAKRFGVIRLAPVKSRDIHFTPQDSRRQNFEVV